MTTELQPRGAPDLAETRDRLLDLARGRSGPIPSPVLVEHVLSVTAADDWRVRREAMEALLRRVRSAASDGLVDDGAGYLGLRQTRRKGQRNGVRPYSTVLRSVDPPAGSCDCPDFLKNALGLCKHLLAALSFIHERPGRLVRAGNEQRQAVTDRPRLFWSPLRPMSAPADWLAQVRLTSTGRAAWIERLLPFFPVELEGTRALAADALAAAHRTQLIEALTSVLASPAYRRSDPEPDPALAELLRWDARRPRLDLDADTLAKALSGLELTLYPYQAEGVERFMRSGVLLLADDMGLGKTAQAIAIAHVLHAAGLVNRGLLIVPASLKGQWAREWARFTRAPVEVIDGSPEERRARYEAWTEGFLILNYELVVRDLEPLLATEPELVVLDEAQRIKNWVTKTARCVKRFAPKYRLVLTGTPMQNRLEELASVMEWVDERALEPRWRLVPLYTESAGDGGRGLAGARNLDDLRAQLAGAMLRRTRSAVLGQLPERTDTVVPVEMTLRQSEAHDELELPIRRLLAMAAKRPLMHEEFLRLMMFLNKQRVISNALAQAEFQEVWPTLSKHARPTSVLLAGLHSPKLLELRELVRSIAVEQGRKVVVFSEWRRILRLAEWAVRDILAAEGLRAVFFTGAEPTRLRDRAVVELHDDPAVRVMFLSDAGGVGLNLQRAASCCINLELPWNPAVLEQRIGRIHRMGQSEPVDVYNFVTSTGVEQRIERLVRGKRALFDAVFDGTGDEVRFEERHSFLERLEREYVPPISEQDAEEGEDRYEDDHPAEGAAAAEEVIEDGLEVDEARPEDEHRESGRDDSKELGTAPPRVAREQPSAAPGAITRSLFDRVRIERTTEGGLRIEAPPDAARELAAVLEGMARLFRDVGLPDGP